MNSEPKSARQCKAQSAGNGEIPFPRAATLQWRADLAPKGQGKKQQSALLPAFAVDLLQQQASAAQLVTSCLAESIISTWQEH